MRKTLIAALLALTFVPGWPAIAQSAGDLAKAEAALDAIWEKMPLTIRHALFVKGVPSGYGIYEPRPDSKFKAGETLVTYAEPVGYGWKNNGDGTVTFGFDVDLAIKSADGAELQKQPNFGHLALTSHEKNREFLIKLTLDLTGAPAGDYVVEYTLRDIASSKTAVIGQPFSIEQGR